MVFVHLIWGRTLTTQKKFHRQCSADTAKLDHKTYLAYIASNSTRTCF